MTVTIHPTAIVDDGASFGEGTRVWHWTHICGGARIGERCSLGQNVFVGNDVVIGNNCNVQNNVSIYDAVTLEDDVFCGPSMVFTNVYNPRSAVVRKDEYRRTLVKKGATIGAVVNHDVKPYALMVGVPARQVGWMSEYGERWRAHEPAAARGGQLRMPAQRLPLSSQPGTCHQFWETAMQVEAIYNQGRIELTQPLQLRHPRVRVIVEVPNEEVLEAPSEAPSMASESPVAATLNEAELTSFTDTRNDILCEIKHILGSLYRQRSAASVADDKQALLDSLAEKHGS